MCEGIVAPQDWVALTGPCQTCKGEHDEDYPCLAPDCRDGRRIVPLYTECPGALPTQSEVTT